jgi:hypothetical protein
MNGSKVWLLEAATGQPVEASLFNGIASDHLSLWTNTWQPEMRRYVALNPTTDPP